MAGDSGVTATVAKLAGCKDCGHQVSVRAKVCPNCGVKKPGVKDPTAGETLWGLAILVVIFGGAYVWLSSGRESTPALDANQDESLAISQWSHSVAADSVCKAAIGTIMGREPRSMTTDGITESTVFISYVRADDGIRWAYRCRFEGNRVVWGNADGRWRTDPADSVVTFAISGQTVTITDRFDDGSSTVSSFAF